MKTTLKLFLLLSLSCGLFFGAQAQEYNKHFTDNALRIDFSLAGNNADTKFYLEQMKQLESYAGSRSALIDEQYMGDYRYSLSDIETDSLLFARGFNSLFREWQSTPEAELLDRSYYHCIVLPFPIHTVKFKLQQRQRDGKYTTLFTREIDPEDYFIVREKTKNFASKKIADYGAPSNHVDLVFIPEGYTAAQMDKFEADIQRLTDYMFDNPPFDKHREDFNLYAVFAPSDDEGTDIPGKDIYRNTAFNTTFYTFDSPRYLTTKDLKAVYDAAELVPFDQIYVLVNTDNYGGGGFYNYLNLTSVDHPKSPQVFVHEFCHGFAGLADEYYNPNDALEFMYELDVEPWEPNITTLTDFKSKWEKLIDKKTPIPTPRTTEYLNHIGVFEGGGYLAKGVYSPAQDCRMKTNEAEGYCPVCQKAIVDAIHKTIRVSLPSE
ncbi:MAG: M64 family metallopeptidase [Mangrovibacterium sp.]